MENKKPNRKRMRLSGFNYASPGYYFVTICTLKKNNWFGKLAKGGMVLNSIGDIVKKCWQDLPNHYKNCVIDYYVIMPNHFHGILSIKDHKIKNTGGIDTKNTQHGLSEIIRGFKSFSSRRINQLITKENKFHWQNSFYDRVIRDEVELYLIRKYIIENPLKMELSKIPDNLII